MANVKISDLVSVTPTSNDLVLLSQGGNTRNAKVRDIRDKDLRTEVETARDGQVSLDTRLDADKTSLLKKIGDLTTLPTADKSSLVNAVKENSQNLTNMKKQIIDTSTNKTYSFKIQIVSGKPQLVYEEVI